MKVKLNDVAYRGIFFKTVEFEVDDEYVVAGDRAFTNRISECLDDLVDGIKGEDEE